MPELTAPTSVPEHGGRAFSSGVLAFMLTDIEGSTYRWEAFPEGMEVALKRHDSILRNAVLAHGGHVFRTAGDSFHAAFSSPAAAVAAALDAQQALTAENFADVGGLKVRIAVHAGPADARNDDYFGPGVNRAARLLLVAYGGQVLVSGTVADILQGRYPQQASLFNLGRHRFRDLSEPEQVHQLVAPGIASAFPPLRSLGAKAHHLPRPLSPIIGREDLIAEVKQRLARYRLLTLTGSGGAGKSRVAVQVGFDLLDDYPDGVWFIELGPLDDPQLVAERLCAIVGLPVQSSRSATESAVGFFREKRALLILDNCEHLIDAAAQVAEAVASECPSVSVLATSRESLDVQGESVLRVPNLAVPPPTEDLTVTQALEYSAVRLFVERATAATADFQLTEATLSAVTSVCSQVDGVPLAIELAVPRLRTMRPEWIAARLRDRFRVLGSGSRTALPRHRTLQTLFDWSYNLLKEPEQTLLRRLSVFAGGWTADSAIAVVSGDPVAEQEVLDLMLSLAEKSLVVADLSGNEARYRLLETTRQYAFQKLQETNERGRRRRLAEYMVRFYSESLTSWPRLPTDEWIAHYEKELDNLRASLEWAFGSEGDVAVGLELACASLRIWDELALLPERERWFATAIDRVGENTSVQVTARLWLGRTSVSSHGDRSAFSVAIKAAELFRAIGDDLGLGEALTKAGAALLTPQQREEAAPYLDEALEVLKPHGSTKQLASCLRSRAVAAYFAADFEAARSLVSESGAVARAVGDIQGRANAQIALSELEFAEGNIDAAISQARGMINGGQYNRRQLTLALGNLTSYLLAADSLAEAKLTAFNGLHKARALGWTAAIVRIVEHMAVITALEGNPERAARLLGFTEAFYATETASREITEQAGYDRLASLLADTYGPSRLSELKAEGAVLREAQAVQMAMEI